MLVSSFSPTKSTMMQYSLLLPFFFLLPENDWHFDATKKKVSSHFFKWILIIVDSNGIKHIRVLKKKSTCISIMLLKKVSLSIVNVNYSWASFGSWEIIWFLMFGKSTLGKLFTGGKWNPPSTLSFIFPSHV